MTTERTICKRLQVATPLYRFIEDKVLPGTGIDSETFWSGFDAIVHDLGPKNEALLAERDRLQTELDKWHAANPGPISDTAAYRSFLESIGYLQPQPQDVQVTTTNVDAELALYVIHGLLHLCGYDDHAAEGAASMREKERKYLTQLGYPDITP